MKKTRVALIGITLIIIVTAVFLVEQMKTQSVQPNSITSNPNTNTLYIESIEPSKHIFNEGSSSLKVSFSNPTNLYFDNLHIVVKDETGANGTGTLSIEPYQNKTVILNTKNTTLADVFQPHALKFYISQNAYGDIINGQSFQVPQQRYHLKILEISQVQDDTYNSVRYYDSGTGQYEFNSTDTNYCQNFWNYTEQRKQYGSVYFNLTLQNNNTIPLQFAEIKYDLLVNESLPFRIFYSVDIYSKFAVIQPNEVCVIPVSFGIISGGGQRDWHYSTYHPRLDPYLNNPSAITTSAEGVSQ